MHPLSESNLAKNNLFDILENPDNKDEHHESKKKRSIRAGKKQ